MSCSVDLAIGEMNSARKIDFPLTVLKVRYLTNGLTCIDGIIYVECDAKFPLNTKFYICI